ncbi:MAG: long-chain-fatty-acid--CoA ligase [Limnochordia bacterium]|jgi:long-chain acyl-CoA synthetase
MTLYEILAHSAAQAAERVCLRFEGNSYSYHQIYVIVNRIGHYLQKRGVQPGDRVALVLPNSPAFIFAYFAVTGIGAIAVPINPVWTAEELSFVFRDARCRYVIATALPSVAGALAETDISCLATAGPQAQTWENILKTGDASPLSTPVQETDLAVFIYTSGTTGKPKGAMLTHRNLVHDVASTIQAIEVHDQDVFLCVLPLFHCLAATVTMLVPLRLGAEIVLMEQFVPHAVVAAIGNYRISVLVGVPAMFVVLTTANVPQEAMAGVRVCLSGGAPLPVAVLEGFSRAYGIPIREGYGLSEASPVVSVNVPHQVKAGTVGPPIPGVRVRVVDEQGRDQPPGHPGELLVQGENVMTGYFGLPKATSAALRGGWLHTGDIATLDDDGYITIIDRLKDMIIVGGLKVYPREVEEILYAHPKIKEAAVFGVSHPIRGESVKAVISTKPGETLAASQVIMYCRQHLANYKIPKTVTFVNELPKSSSGKILRRMLVDAESEVAVASL